MEFGRFLAILRARAELILATIMLGAMAGVTLWLVLPPRYYAEASAVLEQPAADSTSLAASGSAAISYFLATQRDVVASRSVALRVIESLGLEREPDKARRQLAGANPLGVAWRQLTRLLSSRSDEKQSLRDWLIERLLKDVSVSSSRDSRLLKVGYSAREPEFAATVANAFMNAYLDLNVHLKATPARAENAWLETELKELRETLGQAESKLSQFQQEKGIVATDEALDLENRQLSDISAQLAAAQSEAAAGEARRKQLLAFASGHGGANIPGEVIASPVVLQLREDVAQRDARLKDMARQLGPNHPRYKAAEGELHQLRGQLGSEMRAVAQGLASAGDVSGQREASMRAALDKQKSRLLAMKKDREQMAMLARDVDNAQKAYNGAVQRSAQARIESASSRPNASVVDEAAVPQRPAGPRLLLSVALGGVLGTVIGLGLALLLESLQRLVRSGEDLVTVLGVPTLAVLPPRALGGGARRRLAGSNVLSLPRP